MKLLLVIALSLCVCAVIIQAQRQCIGRPAQQSCQPRPDAGRGGQGCRTTRMWAYENGRCRSMQYLGCGGNGNRFCSRNECRRKCSRQG